MSRPVIRSLILTLAVLAISLYSIKNPQKDLRLGRDLRGGARLVYPVILKPGDNADVIVPQVIDIYKKRVDPQGIAEIQIVREGQDRIVFTMPLPNAKTKALKEQYDAALASLASTQIDPERLEAAMKLTGEARSKEIAALSGGSATRQKMIDEAAVAQDEAEVAREVYEAAAKANPADPALNDLISKAGEAGVKADAARTRALASTLSAIEVRRALELSTERRRKLDQSDKVVDLPSARESALTRIRERHPEATADLDRVLAAFDEYAKERRTLEDPSDLKRLLRGAGVLDFRITVKPGQHVSEADLRKQLQDRGPRNVRSNDARWYKINKVDSWYDSIDKQRALENDPSGYFSNRGYVVERFQGDGDLYMLCWDVPANRLTQAEGDWRIDRAYQTVDQLGRPAIGFATNPRGAALLGELTGRHVNNEMAVLLDDQVYTAPNLNSQITTSGIIQGEFSQDELNYIIRTLGAGALAARLAPEPISESTLGPELGFDNLQKGIYAGIAALILNGAFMLIYYFPTCGGVAVVSLVCNAVMILGVMALNQAAFTLPGIAGVILTFGQAVDSNVLVYERMREEMARGADLRTATRLGFQRAFNSIIDGNVANLIVCAVLYRLGTQEIKGFAVTMVIGVLTTLFAALVINRLIFAILVDETRTVRKVNMLPIAVPALGRALHLNVDWMRLRWIFWSFSFVMVAIGLAVCVVKGSQLLDNDFRGGTQVTIPFKVVNGEKLTSTRQDMQDLVQDIARGADPNSQLALLADADVYPVNPKSDGVTAHTFAIKTLATDKAAVVEALVTKLREKGLVELLPPLNFTGLELDATNARALPAYRIITGNLSDDLLRPGTTGAVNDAHEYVGGLAIVLDKLSPAESLTILNQRLDSMRAQPDFADTLSRTHEVRVLEGTSDEVRAAVVLVRDPSITFFDNEQGWEQSVKMREWNLLREALTKTSSPASADTFSPTIAATFRAQAIVATLLSFLLLGIYIWIRFGAVSYAVAAIVPLVHDVLILIALIALAGMLYENSATQPIAHALGILPFKIDLNMVAALLTVVGYSLNDTIIIMDRIRELRGKSLYATKRVINDAVNQTFSRTIITSGTTFFSTIMLYLFGGEGMRGFAYVLTLGVFVGTYSSIAVTAPIVWNRRHDAEELPKPSDS